MIYVLTPNRLKVTRFPDWMSSGSLSSAPDSSWHMAVTHCKASIWADLMQSTRPKRKRRVDALSYVATSLRYSLHKKQQRYYYTTVTFDIAQHFKCSLHIKQQGYNYSTFILDIARHFIRYLWCKWHFVSASAPFFSLLFVLLYNRHCFPWMWAETF
jgi:hypothetical protein